MEKKETDSLSSSYKLNHLNIYMEYDALAMV